jgi:hypothetical protein
MRTDTSDHPGPQGDGAAIQILEVGVADEPMTKWMLVLAPYRREGSEAVG